MSMIRKHSVRRKWMVSLLTFGIAAALPVTTAYAWWCGTGRMTGGGKMVSLVSDSGGLNDVTSPTSNGYELHCDGSWPNNLEINSHDPNGYKFKLDELQTANCWLQYGNQNPPAAA